MIEQSIPENLRSLYLQEEEVLRLKAEEFVANDEDLALHLSVTEHAMDLADLLRKVPIEDEDMKVIKVLSMRMFNAFGASVKLGLSGYGQNSALIMRDILRQYSCWICLKVIGQKLSNGVSPIRRNV